LPAETGDDVALLLHALLAHDGLHADLLPAVLPLPLHHVMALLQRLQAADLVQPRADGRWAVGALGYGVARRLLRGRDYLVDDF
jgi:hypothetical protein